ncbi:MAG: hypothetical protein QOJ55_1287 [Solirubrobacteraceae bacterium]|nr:hypothetical protein [Solirubrobacteraceae bacterium]
MGLLDDAIREHLELKRRRGADSSEVARQEQEAFGPPRRGDLAPEPAALDEPAAFAAEEHAPRPLQAVEDLPWDEDEVDAATAATQIHTPAEREPVLEPESLQEEEPEPVDEPETEPEPEPRSGAASTRRLSDEDAQPTREFDAHELRAATEPAPPAPPVEPQRIHPEEPEVAPPAPPAAHDEDEPDDEDADVLEETPEFLQETPEHDRLWFEQRPPKDFDF